MGKGSPTHTEAINCTRAHLCSVIAPLVALPRAVDSCEGFLLDLGELLVTSRERQEKQCQERWSLTGAEVFQTPSVVPTTCGAATRRCGPGELDGFTHPKSTFVDAACGSFRAVGYMEAAMAPVESTHAVQGAGGSDRGTSTASCIMRVDGDEGEGDMTRGRSRTWLHQNRRESSEAREDHKGSESGGSEAMSSPRGRAVAATRPTLLLLLLVIRRRVGEGTRALGEKRRREADHHVGRSAGMGFEEEKVPGILVRGRLSRNQQPRARN